MKTAKQYNEMAQQSAFRIVKALEIFKDEPDHIRQQAEQIILQRVQLMRSGQRVEIDGDHLVRLVPEPEPAEEKPAEDDPAP